MSNARNPFARIAIIAIIGIVVLWLINALFFQTRFGANINLRGAHEGGHLYMGTSLGFTASISTLLLFLTKVLFVLFIVGLVAGIAIAVKKHVFTEEDINKMKSTFTSKETVVKETCANCGKELSDDWKVCPFCGKEAGTINI